MISHHIIIKKPSIVFCLVILLLFSISCKKPIETVPASLTVNPTTKEVDASQNNFTVAVTSTTAWSASSDKSWISISPMSGEGNGTIRVDYLANSSSSKRTSNVVVKGNGVEDKVVTINQLGIVPTFSVSPSSQNVTSVSGSSTYTITSNINWTAASDQTWCALTPTNGIGDVKLDANFTANTSTANRQATITFSIDGLSNKTVTLIQSSLVPSLSVSVQNQSVNSSSGSTSFGITSNIPWTATSNQAWCTFNGNSGSGNGTLSVNYSSNTLSTPRTATITISGTGVANQVVSITQSGMLAITTSAITNITSATASSGGNISSDGGVSITARGICWSTNQNPVYTDSHSNDGSGIGTFTSGITGLAASTTYHVRAYAVNAAGTSYGNDVAFTTSNAILPTITTIAVSSITATSATSGGNITSDGGANITARGVCWSTSQNPTVSLSTKTSDGAGIGVFSSSMTGLIAGATYYVRAYAINSSGTFYGNQLSFLISNSTSSIQFNPNKTYGTLTDIEGNVYKTIQIGTQLWMAENLKTTKYSDGVSIPLVTSGIDWKNLQTPGYCWFNNDGASFKSTYGALYNWYTVNTKKLCPTGWHVPQDAEWVTLETYIGLNPGNAMKETGFSHWWLTTNPQSSNETGFTALPGSYRQADASFGLIGVAGYWWSTTESTTMNPLNAYPRSLSYNYSIFWSDASSKTSGYSVRCLKD